MAPLLPAPHGAIVRRRSRIARLREVYNHLQMQTCSFDRIGTPKAQPRLDDGTIVTERNVTQFIRERTRLWRESWVLGPLLDVIIELELLK